MMKKKLKHSLEELLKKRKLLLIILLFLGNIITQAQCVSGCNPNTYVNAVDPNTIEYDNFVAGVSTIAKTDNGKFTVWGEGANPNGVGGAR